MIVRPYDQFPNVPTYIGALGEHEKGTSAFGAGAQYDCVVERWGEEGVEYSRLQRK